MGSRGSQRSPDLRALGRCSRQQTWAHTAGRMQVPRSPAVLSRPLSCFANSHLDSSCIFTSCVPAPTHYAQPHPRDPTTLLNSTADPPTYTGMHCKWATDSSTADPRPLAFSLRLLRYRLSHLSCSASLWLLFSLFSLALLPQHTAALKLRQVMSACLLCASCHWYPVHNCHASATRVYSSRQQQPKKGST